MLRYNALIVNGRSTADLPFMVIVEKNPAPSMAKTKSKFTSNELRSGRSKQTINAYEIVEKQFDIYLHNATMDNVRQFKSFLGTEGWYTSYDDPTIKRYFDDVVFESETLDEVEGYHVHVTFFCDPFEYEQEKTVSIGTVIENHTNAPMFPKISMRIDGSREHRLTIGRQSMVIKKTGPANIVIECKEGWQQVTSDGTPINELTVGDFFVINPGRNSVSKSSGITGLTMLARWGWR